MAKSNPTVHWESKLKQGSQSPSWFTVNTQSFEAGITSIHFLFKTSRLLPSIGRNMGSQALASPCGDLGNPGLWLIKSILRICAWGSLFSYLVIDAFNQSRFQIKMRLRNKWGVENLAEGSLQVCRGHGGWDPGPFGWELNTPPLSYPALSCI